MIYKRILLIDDDEDDRNFFVEAVEAITDSAVVSVLDNGIEALKRLAAKQIVADLIFLDLNMPLMKGIDFLRQIRKDPVLKDIPVLILTTSSDSKEIEISKELGVMDFILKPSSREELIKVLKPFLVPVDQSVKSV